jgi:hypothetical protein
MGLDMKLIVGDKNKNLKLKLLAGFLITPAAYISF